MVDGRRPGPAQPQTEAPPGGEPPSAAELRDCLRVLRWLVADRAQLARLTAAERRELLIAAGRLSRPERAEQVRLAKALRRRDRAERKAHDRAVLSRAPSRRSRRPAAFFLPPAELAALPAELAAPPAELAALPAELAALPAELAARATAKAAPGSDEAPAAASPLTPGAAELAEPRACYVCKQPYRRLHHFYHALCPACGDFNYAKRSQTAPLHGRVALLTGGRIKIGFQAALMLLRAGARVIVTTRFARDAALRFAAAPDFAGFAERLEIHGLDLRHLPSVELFGEHLAARLDRLDIVIHNAAQTVRRPAPFYAQLCAEEARGLEGLEPATARLLGAYHRLVAELGPGGSSPSWPSGERQALAGSGRSVRLARGWPGVRVALPEPFTRAGSAAGIWASAELSRSAVLTEDLLDDPGLFPAGLYDDDAQQVDRRAQNSWRMALGEVSTAELLEVHLVNALAPFVLTARLRPLLLRLPTGEKHVIHVSAMEAQFARKKKTDKHPHTNMAKAALNMLTRTSAADLVKDGIHMNSVDTGWVTDEDPLRHVARKQALHDFYPPLDAVDGAARVLDPLFTGLLTGVHPWGCFFKDYRMTEW